MTYKNYLKFYRLKNTTENHENWLANEHAHGRVYVYENKFYDVKTGKEVK